MPLNLRELREWPPEIADLAGSTRQAAANHTNSADFYRSLAKASTWEGDGGDAARAAMVSSAGQHEAVAENLGKAATGMEHAQHEAEGVAQKIKSILDYAAQQPAVQVNEATNQVIPPDTSYLDENAAAKVAAKVADLQAQIAAVLADGERVDGELASAIGTATGTTPPVKKTATSVEDLLMPNSGDRKPPPRPADGAKQPDSLDSALDQLAGKPGDRPATPGGQAGADPATGPVPLDPKKVEQFKALARQTMLNDGVPPDQIEQRLNAMVAAAQKPQPAYTPPKPDKMPPPSFEDGFADGWFGTEEGVRDLVGANGWDDLKKSWTDMAKGAWDRITNPVESWTEEVEHATKYPAHYFGEKAGETALTAPGAMFGGEGALAARAGALDDLTRVGAIPHELIDNPTAASTLEHHTPTPLGDHPLPIDTLPDFGHFPDTGPYPLPDRAQLAPPTDASFFWSGRNADDTGIGPISAGGNGVADLIAGGSHATTLEGLLESKGIQPPKWSPNDTYADNWWSAVSQMYAENTSGEVHAVIGPNLRPGNVWENVELPRLMENPNVTKIIVIDPDTGIETIVFQR